MDRTRAARLAPERVRGGWTLPPREGASRAHDRPKNRKGQFDAPYHASPIPA